MDRKDALKALFEQEGNPTTFHIYHTGSKKHNFSIHTISDSRTTLKIDDAPLARSTTEKSQRPLNDNTLFQRRNTWSSIPTKVKRGKYLDKKDHDPRTETSPYYLHLPTLYGHMPPYTLRHGGTKRAPPACLLNPSWFWRKWTMQFGDVLAQDGVIDGRGVVNIKYGTKKGEDGTLKGYAVRAKRYMGESGKQWFRTQQTLKEDATKPIPKVRPDEVVQLAWASPFTTRTREYHFIWRDFTFKWKGTKSVRRSENIFQPFLRYNHLKLVVVVPSKDVSAKEEEVLLATYTSVPASRKAGRLELYQDAIDDFLSEHIHDTFGLKADTFGSKVDTFGLQDDTFQLQGDPFRQKDDTFQQQGDPFRLQGDTFQQEGDPFKLQGDTFRLQGDTFQLKDDASPSKENSLNEKKASASVQDFHSDSKPDQRLRDLLVASAMCMIISEYQKRQVIIQIILAALNATG
ncbi:uncharacterized protein PAC_01343 [Phialocephala subalpina]|uniref:Uncharacterized protein n=1 Tax=Phialocephala subalpina TaxID=576137 RepID=A0A1L7WFB1_9HELO|nr:uncharacterized protein PAC_01343 [Phialocephala subalpina]